MTTVEQLFGQETRAEERRTSYLELFFDLVFVCAITQVASLMLASPTPGGFARGALVLWLVWWAWGGFAWMTNWTGMPGRSSGSSRSRLTSPAP